MMLLCQCVVCECVCVYVCLTQSHNPQWTLKQNTIFTSQSLGETLAVQSHVRTRWIRKPRTAGLDGVRALDWRTSHVPCLVLAPRLHPSPSLSSVVPMHVCLACCVGIHSRYVLGYEDVGPSHETVVLQSTTALTWAAAYRRPSWQWNLTVV